MRILHTSDWHLGRTFHRVDLQQAQETFLSFLVETVRSEAVDLVVVAGDVYHRALPAVDTVGLCDDGLARLVATGVSVVMISGNHDSATRLGFGSRLLSAAGLHLRTDVRRAAEPVLLADEDGPVAIYGLPYLEPEAVRYLLSDGPEPVERSHDAVITAALGRIRADLAERPGTRSVLAAHAVVTGTVASESERDISVGGVSAVAAHLLSGFDYVALGHLHGAQRVSDRVRYSGSPLPYSFSERSHRKGCWLVDLGPAGVTRVEQVPSPVLRPLAVLRGELADLLRRGDLAVHEGSFVSVTLTDTDRPRAAMEQLCRRFPHTVALSFAPTEGEVMAAAARGAGRSDHEVALDFVRHVRMRPADAAESLLLDEALGAGRAAAAL